MTIILVLSIFPDGLMMISVSKGGICPDLLKNLSFHNPLYADLITNNVRI